VLLEMDGPEQGIEVDANPADLVTERGKSGGVLWLSRGFRLMTAARPARTRALTVVSSVLAAFLMASSSDGVSRIFSVWSFARWPPMRTVEPSAGRRAEGRARRIRAARPWRRDPAPGAG